MTIKTREFKLAGSIPPLPESELKRPKDNIQQFGMKHPIKTPSDNHTIDGNYRHLPGENRLK